MLEQTFLEAEVQGEEDIIQGIENGGIRKNLLDEFADIAKTDTSISNNGRECMKVYLRIRPFTDEEKEQANNHECMEKDGENAILLNAPKDSFTFKNEKRGREVTHRFTFSHVFGAETTQKEFFDSTSLDVVRDFMDGQNCLVFTYGVTNSGKTYTIQGTPKDGGILPRTLDVLFNSIQDKHYSRMNLKPRYFCDVIKIDEKQEHMEGALRNGLLMSLNKEHFDLNSFLQLEESNNDISKASSIGDESSLQGSIRSQEGDITDNDGIPCDDDDIRTIDDTSISVETQGPVKFAVWVSFAEIYNEQIFDLLEPCPEGKGKKRTTLKLGDDKNGNPYIKGLREICVSSADEAYKILRVGKKNQRISSTKLNQNSSRSHCIFSVKVLRVVDVEDPHVARVSRLSFVDLAGSERYTKTQSTGERLKESGNINTSLMTLGKCLENLRYNQMHPNNLQIIPFRESKLTRLFQGFFCGKGKASMIVNINQCANTFDETYHALKFSAIAKQVTTRVAKPVDMAPPVREKSFRPSFAFPTFSKDHRKSIPWENGALTTPAVNNMDDDDDNNDEMHQYIQQLENLVRQFESELIEEKKAKATLELKIREEVCAEMAQQLVAIETAYSERIQDEVSAVEEKCERRIEILAKSIKKTRKRARIERPDDDEDENVSLAQLRSEKDKVKNLTTQVNDLTDQVSDLTAQLKQYESNVESMKTALEDSEKTCKTQEEVMVDLQSALETSSKELEIARLKIDKRDKMLKEKEELIEQLQKKLDEQTKTLEENNDLLEQKTLKISALEKDLSHHQQALDDNESFLAQLNEQVKQLSSELTKNKNQEQEGTPHHKDIKLETALAKKISRLREQLLAKDELMKELVQSLEETRSQVELEKGDLAMVCNKQKKKIEQLEADLEAEKESANNNQEEELACLKEQLKKAEDQSINAKEEVETNCFEKEELKCALDAANAKLTKLEQETSSKSAKALEILKALEEANTRVGELEEMLETKKQEVDVLNDKVESLEMSKEKAKELFGKLEDEVSRQEKTLVELEKLKHLKTELNNENSRIVNELQCKEKELKNAATELEQLTEKLENLAKVNGELRIINTNLQEKEKKREQEKEQQQESENITKIVMEDKEKQREQEQKSLEAANKIVLEAKEKEIQKLQAANQKLINDMVVNAQKSEEHQKEKETMLAENILLKAEVEQLTDKQQRAAKENEELKSRLDSTEKVVSVEEETGDVTQTKSSSKEFQELEKQLKATTIALDKKNSQLISRNNAVKRLELSLSEKEAKILELTKSQNTPSTPGRDLRVKEEVKTLRRRLVQADKDSEEYKQKLHNHENKIADLNKHAEDMNCQLNAAHDKERKYEEQIESLEDKVKQLNEKVLTVERDLKEVQEKWVLATKMIEEKEDALQRYSVQQGESKDKEQEYNKEIEQLQEELKISREKMENKNQEISQLKVEAQNYSKKMEEISLQHCDEVKKNQDEMKALIGKMENAEAELTKKDEKQKNFEDSKEEEMTKLQRLIEEKEKQLTQKSESLQTLQKKFTETDKEKSEELDKVWKTMVELQDVIKERGQTIDDLESKLSKAEARHSREKATLENTVAKIKEVMETKGGDRKKLMGQITELESKVSALNENNKKLMQASEQSDKDLQELKKVLEQQDVVMEEQEKALNDRQAEIESLLAESNQLQGKLDDKLSKTENTTAEVRRLEGTLAAFKDEKEKLENQLKEMRKEDEEQQLTKVEMSRDHEKEKSDMLVKLEKKEGNISKVKAQVKTLQSDKKALEQKCKEKEAEMKKLEKRLKNAEEKQQEYEELCQVKDADIRAASKEKDTMLKAMHEALAIASSKKEEFEDKIKTLKEEHQNEITQLRKQCEVDITTKMLRVDLTKIEEMPENQQPKVVPKDSQSNTENEKPKRQRRTTRTRKTTAVSSDENDAPSETSNTKESSNEEVLSDITPSVTNNSIKILRDEPIPDDRIEIDVTPMQRRKRASRAATGSKTKPKKRRSSELPLSEVKKQLSAKRAKQEQSEEEFTPGSVIRTRRATRASSTSSSCSARKQRPPLTPMTPMNEASNKTEQVPSSAKKKRFFGKLFSGSTLENTPPKRGRRLLKKDISAPMDSFSPCIASITTSTKKSNKAGSIIQRQLRSRVK